MRYSRRRLILLIVVAAVAVLWGVGRLMLERQRESVPAPAVLAPYTAGMDLRAAYQTLPDAGARTARLRVLEDNSEAWAVRWAMLANTRHRIDVSYFILKEDIFGMSFLGHLLHKAQEGVRIRVLLDALGTKMSRRVSGNDYIDALVNDRHVSVKMYRPVVNRYVDAFLALDPAAAIASDHDKILVCDARTSVMGGRNISREYFADPRDFGRAFRDADVVVQGRQVAAALTGAFDAQYHSDFSDAVNAERLNIKSRAVDLLLAYRAMDAWLHGRPLAAETRRLIAAKHLPWIKELQAYPHLRGALTRQRSDKWLQAEVRVVDSRTRMAGPGSPIGEALLRLTRSSREHILAETPYLVLPADLLPVLGQTAARGVSMEALTNSPLSSDNPLSQAFFLEQWPELLARVPGLRLFVAGDRHNVHAKLTVFDRRLTVIGTYNLDPISMAVNSEVVLAVWSPAFAKEAAALAHRMIDAGPPLTYEYRIRRNSDGQPQRDGDGRVEIAFGAHDHSPPEVWGRLQLYRDLLRAAEQLGVSPFL